MLQGLQYAMAEFNDFHEEKENFEFSEDEMTLLKPFFYFTGNSDVSNYLVVEMATKERQKNQKTMRFFGKCLKNADLENNFTLEFIDQTWKNLMNASLTLSK